jgi:excisionase family DNA binding protein
MEYDFLTVEEVAKTLKVVKITIYRYIKAGKLDAYKIGKEYRIKKEELDRFLQNSKKKN